MQCQYFSIHFPAWLYNKCAEGSCFDLDSKNSTHYIQHKRPFCISIYKLEPKVRVAYLIQHGRECCKWPVELSNFIDLFAK